ncbi:MAG: hypothetical protein LBB54_01385 [Cellulomonadaceae bacterium]|jgi:hypothetical protein|nr:hypothetical protein [Cellulomonadaceae bacterium]
MTRKRRADSGRMNIEYENVTERVVYDRSEITTDLHKNHESQIEDERKSQDIILNDLALLGYSVTSIYDLANKGNVPPDTIPVLLKHLQIGGYSDMIMVGLGGLLSSKQVRKYWQILKKIYLESSSEIQESAAASAMYRASSREVLEELMELALDGTKGDSRIFFVRPISRHGQKEGRDFLRNYIDDPVIGKEVRAVLSRYKDEK